MTRMGIGQPVIQCHQPRLPPRAVAPSACGISRLTLGALMNVLDALDLSLGRVEIQGDTEAGAPTATRAETIELAAYPLLQQLAWHV